MNIRHHDRDGVRAHIPNPKGGRGDVGGSRAACVRGPGRNCRHIGRCQRVMTSRIQIHRDRCHLHHWSGHVPDSDSCGVGGGIAVNVSQHNRDLIRARVGATERSRANIGGRNTAIVMRSAGDRSDIRSRQSVIPSRIQIHCNGIHSDYGRGGVLDGHLETSRGNLIAVVGRGVGHNGVAHRKCVARLVIRDETHHTAVVRGRGGRPCHNLTADGVGRTGLDNDIRRAVVDYRRRVLESYRPLG